MDTKDGDNSLMATDGKSTEMKRFVLVHGACQGAWCHRVTVLDLAASGINPKQVNDLRSFSDYIQPLMEFMDCISIKQEEKMILVGHSLGGLVISKAMETFQKRSLWLFFSPRSCLTCYKKSSTLIFSKRGDSIYTYDEAAKGTSTNFMFGPGFTASNLYELSSPEDLALASTMVRPIRVFTSEDMSKQMTVCKQKYGSVKRVYIISELDKGVPKDFQRLIIERDSVDDVKEITGSDHMVMMSKPHELFACLHEIAGEA
ncbi:hypothetical protein MKX01_024777 [Papaver californicum]|nr:hypothetical protein MKX01_024777 [Papaver californicum]